MILARATGRTGLILGVWGWRGDVVAVEREGDGVRLLLRDGGEHRHSPLAMGWRVAIDADGHRRVTELGALASVSAAHENEEVAESSPPRAATASHAQPARFELAERHYRGSEQSWLEAGRPSALVEIAPESEGRTVTFTIDVPRSHRIFRAIDAPNPYDNEAMAINADGVQLYVIAGRERGGWLLVPEPDSASVGARTIDQWSGAIEMTASWSPLPRGYRLIARVALPDSISELSADVLVNEMAPDRERRRGQLVMSGADAEFVYLRGDRHDPERLLRFSLPR
jgi:hypothetical protein